MPIYATQTHLPLQSSERIWQCAESTNDSPSPFLELGLVKCGKSRNVRRHVLTIYGGDRDLAKQGDVTWQNIQSLKSLSLFYVLLPGVVQVQTF